MQPGSPRPSNREVISKIADALAAIEAGRRQSPLTKHLAVDLPELGLLSRGELWALLPELLREIEATNPLNCYAGGYPPQRSYEPEVKDADLWVYRWQSARLKRVMYIKFAMKKNRAGQWVYFHVDLHPDRP